MTHHSPDGALKVLGAPARCQGGLREPSLHPSHRPSREGGSISTAYGTRKRGSEEAEAPRRAATPAAEPRPSLSGSKGRVPPAPPPPGADLRGRGGNFHSAASRESGIKGNCSGGPVGRPGGNPKPPQLFPVCRPAGPRGARGEAGGAPRSTLLALAAPASRVLSLRLSVLHPLRSAPGPFLYLIGSRTSLRSRFLGPGLCARVGTRGRPPQKSCQGPWRCPRALGQALLLRVSDPVSWAPPSPASTLHSPGSQHGSLHEELGSSAAFTLHAQGREPPPPNDLKLNPWRQLTQGRGGVGLWSQSRVQVLLHRVVAVLSWTRRPETQLRNEAGLGQAAGAVPGQTGFRIQELLPHPCPAQDSCEPRRRSPVPVPFLAP